MQMEGALFATVVDDTNPHDLYPKPAGSKQSLAMKHIK